MKLRFTERAANDIAEIAGYIRAENPAAAERVRASIMESLQILAAFPNAGRRQNVKNVRKLITRKYHYAVYYTVREKVNEIVVLTIRHPARKPASSHR